MTDRPVLCLSPDLALPLDAVTEAFGVVGVRGSGKSYASKVLVEELTKAGLPVAIMDPLGVHWGLRSSADGERPGFPFVIFGGDHADVPLSESAGEVVADFVISERQPTVLDMSLMRKAEMRRFATAFLSRLYHRNRQPLHLVVDEADLFAPQRVDDPTLLGAMEDIVRRGRAKGLGCTLITQRPAVISKDVLTQIGTLIALRLAGPQDRKALDEWVRANGTAEQRDELLGSLASLPTGTAWVWSPHWLGIFQKVAIRPLETFDSSATPKSGEAIVAPRAFAEVDLEALKTRIASTIERAKADDPRELRKRIADLERELKTRPKIEQERIVERVEVEVVPAWVDVFVGDVRSRMAGIREQMAALDQVLSGNDEPAVPVLAGIAGKIDTKIDRPSTVNHRAVLPESVKRVAIAELPESRPQSRPQIRKFEPTAAISVPQQRILDALARLRGARLYQPSRQNVAALAGYSWRGGRFSNLLGELRSAGLIEYPAPNLITSTDDGLAAAGPVEPIGSLRELHDAWRAILPRPEASLMDELISRYPDAMTREELAEATGYTAAGGRFSNLLGALRSFGLAEYPGRGLVRADDVLFPEIGGI